MKKSLFSVYYETYKFMEYRNLFYETFIFMSLKCDILFTIKFIFRHDIKIIFLIIKNCMCSLFFYRSTIYLFYTTNLITIKLIYFSCHMYR